MVIINSFVYPESNILYQRRNVRAILDKNDLGIGQLFISESTLAWQLGENRGFTIPYSDITLHAISKDEQIHQRECVYVVTDEEFTMPAEHPQENGHTSDDDDVSTSTMSEIVLIPEGGIGSHSQIIQTIFDTIGTCQGLNPDPADVRSEDEEDHLYEDAEEAMDDEENDFEEGEAVNHPEINGLARRMQNSSIRVECDGTIGEEEDFQDAD